MTRRLKYVLLAGGVALAAAALPVTAADLTASCAGCHGVDGVSTDPNAPTIAGMSIDYLNDTLQAYKKKVRPATEITITAGDKKGTKSDMVKALADLSDADITNLATIYAGKKFVPAKQTYDATLAAKGKDLHDKLCEKCHSESGSVASDDSGLLAGQWMPYLKTQMADYKAEKRPLPAKMKLKFDQVQASDFDALAAYYASAAK